MERPLRQPDVLRRVRPHVLRGVHRVRVPDGRGVRLGVPARPARPVRAHRVVGVGRRRVGGGAAAGHHRRLGGPRRRRLPAGKARGDGGPGQHHEGRRRAHPRLVQRALGRLGHRDPQAAVPAGLSQPECHRAGPGHRATGGPAPGERGAVRLPDDGRYRHLARPHRAGVPVPAAAAARPPPVAAVGRRRRRPAVGRRADSRVDHDRGGQAAMDRLRGDAGVVRRDRRQRPPDRLRDVVGGVPHPGGDHVLHPEAPRARSAARRPCSGKHRGRRH